MPSTHDTTKFIRSSFRSVWALELLRFLKRQRDRAHSHADMVTELRASDLVVTQSLASLAAAGLIGVEVDKSARYCPANEELDNLVNATETLYQTSPDAVRRMIVAASSPGIAAFADAFRLRRD